MRGPGYRRPRWHRAGQYRRNIAPTFHGQKWHFLADLSRVYSSDWQFLAMHEPLTLKRHIA